MWPWLQEVPRSGNLLLRNAFCQFTVAGLTLLLAMFNYVASTSDQLGPWSPNSTTYQYGLCRSLNSTTYQYGLCRSPSSTTYKYGLCRSPNSTTYQYGPGFMVVVASFVSANVAAVSAIYATSRHWNTATVERCWTQSLVYQEVVQW